MAKDKTENKDQSTESQNKQKKALIQKRKKIRKIFLTELHTFNQLLIIQS